MLTEDNKRKREAIIRNWTSVQAVGEDEHDLVGWFSRGYSECHQSLAVITHFEYKPTHLLL